MVDASLGSCLSNPPRWICLGEAFVKSNGVDFGWGRVVSIFLVEEIRVDLN